MPSAQRIPLNNAPSGMEELAAGFRGAAVSASFVPAKVLGDGMVLCRCGGKGVNDRGPVPAWFGRNCIEPGCTLKCRAAS